jgi:SAM-dependent methyltransferase
MIGSHNKTIYEIIQRETVHPFPARMAPGIALEVLAAARRPLRVLDPIAGSGTVLAVARSKGHRAVGIDIDPLAVLISRVWTTAIDPAAVRDSAAAVLTRAKKRFKTLSSGAAYPGCADRETRLFISYWFDGYARRQLAALALAIERVRDSVVRDVLWCGFSRLIVAKQAGASRAMDLAHSRPHRAFQYAPVKPFTKFAHAVDRVVDNCIDRAADNRGPATRIAEGDARSLPLADETIDLVLTSPPYLNAIDYMRCSKFSLVWMGHGVCDLRSLRSASIGTEVGSKTADADPEVRRILARLKLGREMPNRQRDVLTRYVQDVRRAVGEVARVLVRGGRAVYVVGENTVRGTFIRNARIVTDVAEASGLKLAERRVRALPANRRYLPPPSRQSGDAMLDGRMRREVVLAFAKS